MVSCACIQAAWLLPLLRDSESSVPKHVALIIATKYTNNLNKNILQSKMEQVILGKRYKT